MDRPNPLKTNAYGSVVGRLKRLCTILYRSKPQESIRFNNLVAVSY